MSHDPVVIVSAARTPIGAFSGALASVPAHMLGSTVLRAVLERASFNAAEVSEVILGQVLTAAQGQNPARQASLQAGIPKETPAWGLNQVCGSGLRAAMLGAQAILAGDSEVVIAGGQENMSLAPHAVLARPGLRMGDGTLTDTMIKDGLWEAMHGYHMGVTAENIAREFGITREMQDAFAASSQQKCEAARKAGAFKDEMTPVVIADRKGEITVDADEFPRDGVTAEALGKLRPAFDKEGTVTAGNASGINDGAAAVLMMRASQAEKRGLTPLARVVSYAQAGVEPRIMGTGPIPASEWALQRAGWKATELDLIEANEAFAVQAIAVNQKMGWDMARVNISGGAIALGHPIGASGARCLVTLLYGMQRTRAQKGLVTLCIGGGMGVAVCVERV
jgi:acetyl-CoA C-acetyltransferase